MAIITAGDAPIALDGTRKARGNLTKARIRWVIVALVLVFGIVAGRLIQLGATVTDSTIEGVARDVITASRPPILDRNGLEMAVDIRVPSLFAEPRRIIDVEEAVQKLRTVLPDLDEDWLRKRLTGDKGFVWIKRELTPAIEEKIFQLGIPGLDFVTESKRFYPGGREASHILGAVNIDNQGTMGIEKHMDDEDLALLQSLGLARGNETDAGQPVDRPARPARDVRAADRCADPLQGDRCGGRDDGHQDRRDHRHGLAARFRPERSARRCSRTMTG